MYQECYSGQYIVIYCGAVERSSCLALMEQQNFKLTRYFQCCKCCDQLTFLSIFNYGSKFHGLTGKKDLCKQPPSSNVGDALNLILL